MDTGICYVQVHGARLGWAKRTLEAAGVAVHAVTRDTGSGLYYLAVATDNADRASSALLPLQTYQRKQTRASIETRAIRWISAGGMVAAGLCALVAPAAGAIVIGMVGMLWIVLTQLTAAAREMRPAGGRYYLAGTVGLGVMFAIAAAFFVAAGCVAGVQIAEGNSALKLLQVHP